MEELFYELFSDMPRLGPGDHESTMKALMTIPIAGQEVEILDVGCGTGAQTLELAKMVEGTITAVDNYQPYLDQLWKEAKKLGLGHKIKCVNADMLDLQFPEKSFDIIWGEGSIYIMGFEIALRSMEKFLKEGGYLSFSHICWFKENPPSDIREFWEKEYPGIKTVEEIRQQIKEHNYDLMTDFPLPERAWWESYYDPLTDNIAEFREKYQGNDEAMKMLDWVEKEIDMYAKYSDYYGYQFFVMKMRS